MIPKTLCSLYLCHRTYLLLNKSSIAINKTRSHLKNHFELKYNQQHNRHRKAAEELEVPELSKYLDALIRFVSNELAKGEIRRGCEDLISLWDRTVRSGLEDISEKLLPFMREAAQAETHEEAEESLNCARRVASEQEEALSEISKELHRYYCLKIEEGRQGIDASRSEVYP